MKRVLILAFVLLLLPSLTHAKFYTLPSGLLYEIPEVVKVVKKFTLPSGLEWWGVHFAEASELSLEELIKSWFPKLSDEQLELTNYGYRQAIENRIDPYKFLQLINCESKFKYAFGDWRSEENRFMAAGPAQWWFSSWQKYTKQFGLEHLNYKSSKDQIILAAFTIGSDKNAWKAWFNCGKFVGFDK